MPPFEITFRVPSPVAHRGCMTDCAKAETGEESLKAIARFIGGHLEEWPFDEEISVEALEAIQPDCVFYAIFGVISDEAERQKN